MKAQNVWHVIWTTRGCWLPNDGRGNWSSLGLFYEELKSEFQGVSFSEALPKIWKNAGDQEDHAFLNETACIQLNLDLRRLSSPGGDRVAGNAPLLGIAVRPTNVQLILTCPAGELSQRVGRLKSRSSTLLSFVSETQTGGKGTWGTGFWYASLPDPEAVSKVVKFVDNA